MSKKGFTIWFTGLPCAGKTTLATELCQQMRERELAVELLDGDEVRKKISSDLSFSKEDRDKNLDRVAYIAQLLNRNGIIAVCAFVSPYRAKRDVIRKELGHFVEIFVKCPLEICRQRDQKGMYKKAQQGQTKNFTGVSDPYEEPLHPEVLVETDKEAVSESMLKIIQTLETLQLLPRTGNSVYSTEEQEQLEERLRTLGYL